MGRITGQQQTSHNDAYSSITFDITQDTDTEGYLLFIQYGWNYFRADMAIGAMWQRTEDNALVQTLFYGEDDLNLSMNGLEWEKSPRQIPNVSDIIATTASGIEDELASNAQGNEWKDLVYGSNYIEGWNLDITGTSSSRTGPSSGNPTNPPDESPASNYYIYCETSGQYDQNKMAYCALRVPITISN